MAKSKGDARRALEQGGAYVNNRRIDSVEAALTASHLASDSVMVLAVFDDAGQVASFRAVPVRPSAERLHERLRRWLRL